jgi:GNAT superfamily N-acetyltransferase
MLRMKSAPVTDILTFRPAAKADLPDVLRLYAQPDLDNGRILSLAAATRLWERMAKYPDYQLHLAVERGQVVGTFALLIMDNLGHLGTPSAVVEDVAVDPAWHGRGIGTAMMRHAIEMAEARGCYKLALSSNLKRDKAHLFYESLGFERHGYSFRIALPLARQAPNGSPDSTQQK